jgi:ubiquinone/menaquinone biosynthesis C-methylase UbiE
MVAGIDLSGRQVLDIGSGLDGVDTLLATTHGAAAVVGIDFEPQLVESARALIAARGLTERMTFQLVEPGPLRFSDASFDVAACCRAAGHDHADLQSPA